jgi:hypothetical protein
VNREDVRVSQDEGIPAESGPASRKTRRYRASRPSPPGGAAGRRPIPRRPGRIPPSTALVLVAERRASFLGTSRRGQQHLGVPRVGSARAEQGTARWQVGRVVGHDRNQGRWQGVTSRQPSAVGGPSAPQPSVVAGAWRIRPAVHPLACVTLRCKSGS